MSKKRIMLVDDESGFTRLMHLVLPNYEICEVNDSRLVLETARKFKPELIFLDVIMPEFDGGDVAAQLREDPALKHVPIVFLTAIVLPKETATKHVLGGDEYLAKPVTKEQIIQCVTKHLGV
jgi:CheY-like chemotaxis protein